MNIKDFLIDNYIWIIVIILITIITIIGFLADKKKEEKKKQENDLANSNIDNGIMNNSQPMQYVESNDYANNQINNNMAMNYNNSTPSVQGGLNTNIGNINVQPVVTEPTPVPVNVVPTNNMNQMNNPLPVENVAPRVEQESMYQPLSEQPSLIEKQPNSNIMDIQQPMNQSTIQNMQNLVPTSMELPNTIVNNPQMIPINNETMMNQNQNFNISNNMAPVANKNIQTVSNMNQTTTIPQPINPTTIIPTPQPVEPQSIMPGSYDNSQTMPQQNYNQPMPQSNISPTVNQMSQPINFVYGPPNNNQNM